MSTPSFVVRVLLLGAVTASYALTCMGGVVAAPSNREPAGAVPAAPATPVVVPVVPAAEVAAAVPPVATMARFPGGHSLRTLNGVAASVDMPWPADRPWSPVAGVVHDQGQDWYRHRDGSWSTTAVDPTDANHAIGLVFTPAPVRSSALRGQ